MAKLLYAPNEPFIKLERSKVRSDLAAGVTTIVLESTQGYAADDYIVLGHEGSETCEIRQVTSVDSATQLTVSAATSHAHDAGEPAVKYRYNQRKFYGATSATGSYTLLATVDIQVDDPQGSRYEYTGSTYTYFKATYYNSTDATETSTDDAEAVLADESLRYATIDAIRTHAGLGGNPFYSDARVEVKRRQAENEINSVIYSRYTLPLTEVPELIGQICELLAAGYIDFEEFGKDGEGVKWLGEARSLLKGLAEGKRLLIGSDGTELTRRTNAARLSGVPNDATEEDFMFKVSDQF